MINLIGLSSIELVTRLPELIPEAQTFWFHTHDVIPPREKRFPEELTEKNFDLFLSEVFHGREAQEQNSMFPIPKTELTFERIQTIIANLPTNTYLSIRSTVDCSDRTQRHMSMMDFKIHPTVNMRVRLKELLHKMNIQSGVILYSGNSFHFLGFKLLDQVSWLTFLGNCIKLTGFVDVRYIGHRLVAGACALRVSSGAQKPNIPLIVETI